MKKISISQYVWWLIAMLILANNPLKDIWNTELCTHIFISVILKWAELIKPKYFYVLCQ